MLAPEFLPVWGGVGTYIVELVRHLPKDTEVHVLTPMREGFGNEEISTSDYDLSTFFGSNVHVHFVSKASDTFFYNAKFQFACLKHVPKIIKEENIDLIHSHTAHMPDLLLMLRRLNKPNITTVHTTIKSQRLGTKVSNRNLRDLEMSEKATYLMYPALRFAEDVYFRLKRVPITPSNWMKKWLEDNFNINGNIKVIPNSVDMNDYESKKYNIMLGDLIPQELRNRKIILYVGRLLAMKGVDILIKSIPEIINKFGKDELLFVFVGPGDNTRYISRVDEMRIKEYCFFTGHLPRQATIQLMMLAEIMVLPSFHENCPYAILESMACGIPVISTDVGGVPEIIETGYNGILVKPGSTRDLADAIVNLLEDKSLRNLISLRAKETIRKNFSWSVNIKKYLETYSNALSCARADSS